MDSSQIRSVFTDFYRQRGHSLIVGSSLLSPEGDNVLFTTSGMHSLTPYLAGRPHPQGERLVDVEVPGFARKVIKPTNNLKSVDEWYELEDGTFEGTFDLETKGVPIETGGRTRLWAESDDSTGYEITVTLDVKVPLIGGRIASYSKGIIDKQLADEFRLGDEWLDSHNS
jgi:hypothetical protein